ncbi:MAG: ribonuclease HI [Candidatus Paceibacterota bacterium]|jgi:ribonuclease HI
MSKTLEIYTDGSSLGNPGPGGWGVLVIKNEELRIKNDLELGGGEKNTTNNRMELKAAIEALKYLRKSDFLNIKEVIINADSSYVLNGITSWIFGWEKNGWRTANKKPVMNQELWQELIALVREFKGKIIWQKVKGHSGHIYNDKADLIATTYAAKQKRN